MDARLGGIVYPLQISVNRTQIMHVPRANRNTSRLNGALVRLILGQATVYKLTTVHVPLPLNEFVMLPYSVHSETRANRDRLVTPQWQCGMTGVFPSSTLSVEYLRFMYQGGCNGTGKTLTSQMASRSPVTCTRTTLTIT